MEEEDSKSSREGGRRLKRGEKIKEGKGGAGGKEGRKE